MCSMNQEREYRPYYSNPGDHDETAKRSHLNQIELRESSGGNIRTFGRRPNTKNERPSDPPNDVPVSSSSPEISPESKPN